MNAAAISPSNKGCNTGQVLPDFHSSHLLIPEKRNGRKLLGPPSTKRKKSWQALVCVQGFPPAVGEVWEADSQPLYLDYKLAEDRNQAWHGGLILILLPAISRPAQLQLSREGL